jgi:predicted alpha/beta hydrolase family esterase
MAKPAAKPLNVVLFHGYAEMPELYWLPWVHKRLEDAGHQVWAPFLPNPLQPDLRKWIKATSAQAKNWDENTIIIGHSMGGVLALRLLETVVKRRVRAVILVGTPFASTLKLDWFMTFFGRPVDWATTKAHAKAFTVIQSDNDPIVPPDHAIRYQERLAARLVTTRRDGHFLGLKAPIIWRELEKFL